MSLEELIARDQVANLRHAYCAHLDAKELDALMALFTADASCDFGDRPLGGRWTGHTAIRAGYAKHMELHGAPFATLHAVTNPWLRIVDANTAVGRWYLSVFATGDASLVREGGNPLFMLGLYEDKYRRVGDVWRIARVCLHPLWPQRDFAGLQFS